MIAGGVESMTRAPFVMPKADEAFSRSAEIYDTTIGWRFVNPADEGAVRRRLDAGDGRERRRGIQDLARRPGRVRAAQPATRVRRHRRAASSRARSRRSTIAQKKGDDRRRRGRASARRHHAGGAGEAEDAVPQAGGTVTAGNASGVNDGAAALLLASEDAARAARADAARARRGMADGRRARRASWASARRRRRSKLLARTGLTLADIDVIELNEAFAAQGAGGAARSSGWPTTPSTSTRTAAPSRSAIRWACRGARLALTAVNALETRGGKRALCTMCIGVGQGIAALIERV